TGYLLLHGELPTKAELAAFESALRQARTLPKPVVDIIKSLQTAHPMEVLRTAVSALGAFDTDAGDSSRAATVRKGVRLT
ncbi:citrate/2-methylcitrate synthase, partial [Shewanella algae]|uniref:citrate/2-methylcitrate synthase n=1 Tax=Shewanella algae TaxID=38313 RepID=UPI00313F2488